MPAMPVRLKPGPRRLAAALMLAGFSNSVTYPDITDGDGKTWGKPGALLIALAISGGESSGNAWIYNQNKDGSTDYGLMEVNSTYNPGQFKGYPSVTALNWANYADNAKMAYSVYSAAVTERKAANGPVNDDWKPWNAFADGGFKAERWQGKSWLDWAQYGITDLAAAQAAAPAQPLTYFASIDLDPLVFDQHPLIW